MSEPSEKLSKLFNAACEVGVAGPDEVLLEYQIAGCGSFITADELISSYHVIVDQSSSKEVPKPLIMIKNQDGDESRVKKLVIDQQNDLVYMKLFDPIGKEHLKPCSNLSDDLNDKIELLSNYLGNPKLDDSLIKTITNTRLKLPHVQSSGRYEVYLTQSEVKKGFSGSAILKNGELYSVLSAVNLDQPDEIYGVDSFEVASFIKKARLIESSAPNDQSKDLKSALKTLKLF